TMRLPSRLRCRLMETNPGCFDMKRARSVISFRASDCLPGSALTMVICVTGWLLVWICGMATSFAMQGINAARWAVLLFWTAELQLRIMVMSGAGAFGSAQARAALDAIGQSSQKWRECRSLQHGPHNLGPCDSQKLAVQIGMKLFCVN